MVDVMGDQASTYKTILEENPAAFRKLSTTDIETVIKDETKDLRNPSSAEYYTFAELGLIILYIAATVSETTYEEKKLTTINRIRMSKIKEATMLFAKAIFGIIIGVLQIALVYVYSSVVFDVNWGENTLPFCMIFLSLAIFSSIAGVIIGLVASDENTMNGVVNVIIILFCCFGGSYFPLFLMSGSPVLDAICKITPLYWVNTATSAMVCGIETSGLYVSMFQPLVYSAVLFIFYILYRIRRGVVADV